MDELINKLTKLYPGFTFVPSSKAYWSPAKKQVFYPDNSDETTFWTVFHELGHALLGHDSYDSDIKLLHKEIEAWEKAKAIAKEYSVTIEDDYIQDCLDTYRDWLHKRSKCPSCQNLGLQASQSTYQCFNCQSSWKVTSNRFCRPYRLLNANTKKEGLDYYYPGLCEDGPRLL